MNIYLKVFFFVQLFVDLSINMNNQKRFWKSYENDLSFTDQLLCNDLAIKEI